MPWHTIATMIIVNMCVQCLFNLNFAHVTHINFFLRLNLLVCFFHFFFLMYIRVYIWIMYVCMCMRVCSSCAVLKYFPMKSSLIFISWIASKICFYHATKKDPRNPCFYIWKKIQESSFLFSSVFCSIHLWAISAIIAHQYF